MDESVEQEEEITIEPIAEPVLEAVNQGQSADGTIIPAATADNEDTVSNTIPSIEEDMPVIVEKPQIKNLNEDPVKTTLTLDKVDTVFDNVSNVEVDAPKPIERLEEISMSNAIEKIMEEENINIHTDELNIEDLGILDIASSNPTEININKNEALDPFTLGIEEI